MATAMMVRHPSIGVARRLIRIAVGMDFARTFERRGDGKLACMHRRRRNERRHQEAKKEQAPTQHSNTLATKARIVMFLRQ